jgi:tetratricopeptide (TPR) repeat protein
MRVETDTNRFIVSPLQAARAGLYQHLFGRAVSFQELGNRLIHYAEHAQAIRQVEQVQEAGQLLSNLPLKEYQEIGQYYLAWCDYRNGIDHRELFEHVAEHAPLFYRARALQSLAAIEARKQDYASELRWLIESMKVYPSAEALRGIAIVKAKEGYGRKALNDLEGLLPLARISQPIVFYSWLNSLATEYGEVGRKDEARNISRIVLASPFIHAYPEWKETSRDLKEPNRAFILVPSIEPDPVETETRPKVVSIQAHQAIEPEEPAKLISFPELREAPRPNQPKRIKRDDLNLMMPSQKRELLLAGIKSGRIVEGEYNKLLFITGMVESGPAEQVIDLEDKRVLDDLILKWANFIEPEELAAVMSALRDCKDDSRRANIIDDIIRKAFEYSATCNLSEREWRQKVECRLPEK